MGAYLASRVGAGRRGCRASACRPSECRGRQDARGKCRCARLAATRRRRLRGSAQICRCEAGKTLVPIPLVTQETRVRCLTDPGDPGRDSDDGSGGAPGGVKESVVVLVGVDVVVDTEEVVVGVAVAIPLEPWPTHAAAAAIAPHAVTRAVRWIVELNMSGPTYSRSGRIRIAAPRNPLEGLRGAMIAMPPVRTSEFEKFRRMLARDSRCVHAADCQEARG